MGGKRLHLTEEEMKSYRKEYAKRYRAEHREKLVEYSREYNKCIDKETLRKYSRTAYDTRGDKIRACNAGYYAKNKEHINTMARYKREALKLFGEQ